ncbi:hypothetical protein [Burkholderia sp. CCA53]|uniref:hypothetical protein n=1 Tax=Burkholderia sp. CCA53 TaxID=1776288 RepID=UPI001112BE6A|nr:hypothetical protein [Burkholderia sp. CCA53]
MNCKPGDIAIVTRTRCGKGVGKIVEVVRLAVNGEIFVTREGKRIAADLEGWGVCWVIRGDRLKWGDDQIAERAFPDAYLRPVSGLPITDDIEDEVTA